MTLEVNNLEEALESKIFSVAYSIRDLSDMPVETRSPIKKAEHENESSTHQENNVEENFPQRHNTPLFLPKICVIPAKTRKSIFTSNFDCSAVAKKESRGYDLCHIPLSFVHDAGIYYRSVDS